MVEKRIHVVAAVIERNKKILIAKRPKHLHQGGLWEFPGGKVEANELPLQALKRELFEELDIHISTAQPLIKTDHDYSDKSICLDVWRVSNFSGVAVGKEEQDVLWVSANDLNKFDFPAANKAIVTAAQLPQKYLITPDPCSMNEQQFLTQLENAFKSGITLVQLRSKKLSLDKLSQLYKKAQKITSHHNATLLLNCSVDEANTIGVRDIHLSSQNLLSLNTLPEHFFTAASCHNQHEIEKACELGVNFIVIAPVNKTSTHPGTQPLGWDKFRSLCQTATVPAFALGGMQINDIANAIENGAQGIAAIRALW